MSIKTLIVDDEPLARQYIRHLLQEETELEVIGECGNGKDALEFVAQNAPDLIFLDVQMPEMDGFAFLKNLNLEKLPVIIFTTAYQDYAIRAFEFHALDYLLKPFDGQRFAQAVNRAKEILGNQQDKKDETVQIQELLTAVEDKPQYFERLLIKLNGRIVFLKTRDIDWVKADDKYVHLYSGKTSYLVRQTVSAMKNQLDPQMFVQIHRSAIINIERIKELQPLLSGEYIVILESGVKINVSRSYKDRLFDLIGKPL